MSSDPMSHWGARLEMILRNEAARSTRQWLDMTTSVRTDHPEQVIVRSTSDRGRRRAVRSTRELLVEAQQDGDAVIIVLAGEFDLVAADPVRETVTRALSEPGRALVVDLSEVTFIDVSGLRVLLDMYKLCRGSESKLTIRRGPPNVQRVFELANLLTYLPFEGGG